MEIPRPSDSDKALFRALAEALPGVEVKPMFGNLGAFVNGNMFMGLFGADIGVKLADVEQQALRAAGGGPFGPAERPMSGYVALPAALSKRTVAKWVSTSFAYVAAMPPKKAKPAAKPAI